MTMQRYLKLLLKPIAKPILTVFNNVKEFSLFIMYPQLHLAFRVVSHLTMKERIVLYRLSKNCNLIVEIGSYIGASACCFGAAMKSRGECDGKIFCIDTWNNDAMTEGTRDTWQEFKDNTTLYSNYIVPVRGFSTEVVQDLTKKIDRIDLLFIDGDHSYQGVKSDWEAYKSFLKSGSVVVFHDWGWAEGVKRVITEDVKSLVDHYDLLPNMWWGTIR